MMILKNPNGIWTTTADVITVDDGLIRELRAAAPASPKKRVRLCAHHTPDNPLHEMIIALDRSTYVQPHRHRNKSESFHIIEGAVTLVLFHGDGRVRSFIRLGERNSGRAFFYRLAAPVYHTLLIESDVLIIHETTNGPFIPGETEYATWAPPENESPAVIAAWLASLKEPAE